MAQHFLLSAAAKTLSLASVFTMKDADAEMTFRRIRWHETARRAGLLPLRRDRCLRLPPLERRPPLPLPGLRQGFQHYQRDAVRLP